MPLKLNASISKPNTPASEQPPVQTPGGSKFKLKLGGSKPSTPVVESADALAAASSIKGAKAGKKRGADGELASPAAKRIASDVRRPSLTLKLPTKGGSTTNTPSTAGPRLKLQKRQSSGPKLRRLNVKGRIPDREPGNAYDSEDSERELDPATEQQLVLRMQPGEDCDLLRKAIADRTIGAPPQEGGIDVGIKFLDRDLRRALITVRKNLYAAVLVDLPCIVETMKSWDKRGWWKVADISQMLLVLGRVTSEEEAKHMALPARVINERTMAYAHGLTPPMHWVRKRRFRKRLSYKDTANVEEEVNRLLEEDARIEEQGGEVLFDVVNRESMERSPDPDDYFQEEAISTIEHDGYDDEVEPMEEMDLDDMHKMFQDDETGPGLVASPSTVADATTIVKQETSETPAETPAPAEGEGDDTGLFGDEAESSDDDDDDDDDIDTFDEDAQNRAAEKNQQNQEIEDLENEIAFQRRTLDGMKNQLLRKRYMDKLKKLEEDLRIKKRGFGLVDDDEED